jgi:hypothetical protein
MSHLRFLRLPASLAVVVVALFTLPVAVSAAPPLVETFTNEDSFTFQGPCPNGVTLEASFTETLRVTTFFDEDGTAVRVQITVNYDGVVTNPVTGATVEDISHQTIIVDLVEGTETQVGLVFSSTVPGVGVVFHDVGRVVFAAGDVIFEAGPHDVLNTEGAHPLRARFCEALT